MMVKAVGVLKGSILLLILIVIAFLSGGGRGSVSAAGSSLHGKVHKIIIERGNNPPELPGLVLWHDYGSFRLYKATESTLAGLSTKDFDRVYLADEMNRILIDASPFDSKTDILHLPESLSIKE